MKSPANKGFILEIILKKLDLLQMIELLKQCIFLMFPVVHLVLLLYLLITISLANRNKHISPKSHYEIRQFFFCFIPYKKPNE